MPQTAILGLGLLNKLCPLVAESNSDKIIPSESGQGPILPSFIQKFQDPGQLLAVKPELRLSPRESLKPKREGPRFARALMTAILDGPRF